MQDAMERTGGPDTTEDRLTKSIERYTGAIPSSAYLAVAVGAVALSLVAQVGGRGKWGQFIGQWVPTWLLLGLYNKVVKAQGHDRQDRGDTRRALGISNRSLEEEWRSQAAVPPRGQASG